MIAGLYGKYSLNFIRNCQIVFQSDRMILHFYQQCVKDPVTPYMYQCLVLLFWIILGNLVCNKKYFGMVLIRISTLTSEVVNFFICVLALCIISFCEITMQKFCPFFHCIICFFVKLICKNVYVF